MTIYTGYIYLWYDTRSKLFYLGGHKGKVEDKYVCSSKRMMWSYKKRPETFKFRVIQYVYGDTKQLREIEQCWLNKIKDQELYWTPNIHNKTVKYYNQKKNSSGGNGKSNLGVKHKNPSFRKGYTGEEIELRRNKLYSFVPHDRPKLTKIRVKKVKEVKTKNIPILNITCVICNCEINSKRKTCSKECQVKLLKITSSKPYAPGRKPWNKGVPSPTSAEMGRKGAKRQSETVTGRKRQYREDGINWYWVYPDKSGEFIL